MHKETTDSGSGGGRNSSKYLSVYVFFFDTFAPGCCASYSACWRFWRSLSSNCHAVSTTQRLMATVLQRHSSNMQCKVLQSSYGREDQSLQPPARHQPKHQVHGHGDSVWMVSLSTPTCTLLPSCTVWWQRQIMCVRMICSEMHLDYTRTLQFQVQCIFEILFVLGIWNTANWVFGI